MSMEISEIKKGEEATNLHRQIMGAKKVLGLGYLALGRTLYEMREKGYYKKILGDDIGERKNAWSLYLSLPEVSIATSTARGLMQIYKKFIEELKLPESEISEIDRRKLQAIVPVVDDNNCEDWLGKARELSRSDLFKELKQSGTEIGDIEECEHELIKGFFYKCQKCGEMYFNVPPKKYKSIIRDGTTQN